jgi:hypothetical protein
VSVERASVLGMSDQTTAGKALFDDLAVAHLGRDHVTMGRMFSSEGLAVLGKIFAFVGRDGRLVLKLPLARAEALKDEGLTEAVVLGGRTMREWVSIGVPDPQPGAWPDLMDEAHSYVAELAEADAR